ncbi:4Fe-4S single cluster domain-containing protein [Teredinibacter turnerae]|uniref:4Fe-4S single cluster domain-containing protein n=1 Tax=Teredinibacter turnerae TaxID=2426 RepID=UPI0003FF644D|nr:4Fe-4S single cluster domain-containing protein [Teredinibacter turnerae]
MNLALSRMHFPVTTLGPGDRIGIWFQGCSIRCTGCISKDTWDPEINHINISEVENLLLEWLPKADGITVSGGEPFEQPLQLKRVLSFIKRHSSLSTIVFSGYRYADIEWRLQDYHSLIDLLISEPFDHTQPSSQPLRGSENQKAHALTEIGQNLEAELTSGIQQLDAMIASDSAWFAGIPESDLMHKLSSELSKEGYQITHTQTRIPEPK